MRLICPNCDAQYEVDASAIPEAGRDVQCSNCGHAWFQMRTAEPQDRAAAAIETRGPEGSSPLAKSVPAPDPDKDARDEDAPDEDAPDEEDADKDAQPAAPLAKRGLDDTVLAVLREEAEREKAARRAEAQGIEVQGDLGLPPPVSAAVGSAAALAQMSDAEKRIASMKGERVPSQSPAARRDLLPDIEEINSSLRPSEANLADQMPDPDVPNRNGSGFRSGFVLMMIVAVFAVALYVMAPQITAQIPAASDAMASYVASVDAARATLDGMMRSATGALNDLSGN